MSTRLQAERISTQSLVLLMSESVEILEENHQTDTNSSKPEKMAYRKDGKYWFVCDPCGIVCAVMTYFLIVYGEMVVLVVLAPPFPTLWTGVSVAIFTSLAVLAVVSHVKSMITDPVSSFV